MTRRPLSQNPGLQAPSRQISPRSPRSPAQGYSIEGGYRNIAFSGTDPNIGPNEFALMKDAVDQLQHRIESLEDHVRQQEIVYSQKFERMEVKIRTGTSENPEALSPTELLVNLYHNNSIQFRSNLRSAIRDYMLSSIGSMFSDDNHTELASLAIFFVFH
jgi:hypothetical protein